MRRKDRRAARGRRVSLRIRRTRTTPALMDQVGQQLVSALHVCGRQAVIAVTGGGSLAISDLLSVPGASAFLLEARVPYAPAALTEWLGREPEQSCSRETALAMAVVAWHRATKLSTQPDHAIGVGCTAALASNRPKRGEHRAWIATHSANATRLVGLSLAKGQRDRVSEERLVARASRLHCSRSWSPAVVRLCGRLNPNGEQSRPTNRRGCWLGRSTRCMTDIASLHALPSSVWVGQWRSN
ncbi:MAG: hypothetical protein FD138_1895 [Planctomycetota bacterium]|nr:MAG: hypothetical protein FD138_1895 [Planctomycetota bacterium]